MTIREEKEIFRDLAKLCVSDGFAHVIAYFCYRDNTIQYIDEVKASDYQHMFSTERLVRTEISTLIGLLVRENIKFTLPEPEIFKKRLDKTEALLKELHESMMEPMYSAFKLDQIQNKKFNPFNTGSFLREPIFYGSESAYNFQYRDFSLPKYYQDNDWFKSNKGYSIENAVKVISCIGEIQINKLSSCLNKFNKNEPHFWTVLPGYIFTVDEVTAESGIKRNIVKNILKSFVAPLDNQNIGFKALNDFNITNAYPLINIENGKYLLFQNYSLVEALYETPFYWMGADKSYVNKAMMNRGDFTEKFSETRLKKVFGENNVYKNVDILDSKKQKAGEIDVLVVFANRAIVLQAKSKRLTLESRKGNDKCIKDDFKKSIQDSYNQGLSCSRLLNDKKYKLVDLEGKYLTFQHKFKEIYIFCVVSDHYPALSFQTRQFLKYEQTENILPPFVMDIFLLDVMTEFLQSPLKFLNYINRRTLYLEKLVANHELTILSYHLKQNLWLDNEFTHIHLSDDISADLDLAMMVRREGVAGEQTPDGILTRFEKTNLGNIVHQIEKIENPETVDLGFMLLMLSEDTVIQVSKGMNQMCQQAKNDGKNHDLTVGIGEGKTGLTIHFNNDSENLSANRLRSHCVNRKYTQRAQNWFGLCIRPSDKSIQFGLKLNYEWEFSKEMEIEVQHLSRGKMNLQKKIGRNKPCPCNSGKKYKRCCINKRQQ